MNELYVSANYTAGCAAIGEDETKMLSCLAVGLRACTVSFTGPSGIRHSVEVTAESLYEAAALGLSRLKQDGWVEQIAPGTTRSAGERASDDAPRDRRAA